MSTDTELLTSIIDARAVAQAVYARVYVGKVECQSGDTIDVSFADGSPLPPLCHVPIYVGTPGVRAEIVPGTTVLVGFIGGDPCLPYALGFGSGKAKKVEVTTTTNISLSADQKVAVTGTTKVTVDAVEIDLGGSTAPVARLGDAVVAGPYAGTITAGSAKVKAG